MYLQIKRVTMALFLSLFCFMAYAQQTVTGTVKDATGEPLIGVTVLMDGQPAAITDLDGNFTIENAKSSSVIKVTYVGFMDQQVTVGSKTNFNIVMKEDDQSLDEVVVVGYGTMKKSDLTGAIASADGAKLAAKGTTNAMEALQGSVPGAQITQSTSRAGSSFDIQIRGKSSIEGDTKPLYVVDGIITDNIDFLNPQDIEKIDILKDASSTAIYGSRATAGVVMVTTKSGAGMRGREAKPTISYDGYYGIAKVARMPEFMNGEQFYKFRFSNFLASGQVANGIADNPHPIYNQAYGLFGEGYGQMALYDEDENSVMKQMLADGNTHNWPKLVTQDGQRQNHYLSVNGSTEALSYHFGVGYNREEGVYKGDNQNRYNMKGSLDAKINNYVSAGFSINMAYTQNRYASDDAIKIAFRQVPFAQPYNAEGELNEKPANYEALGSESHNQFTDTYNSLVMLRDDSKKRQTLRLLGNVYVQVKPFKFLTFKSTFSPNFVNRRTGEYTAASCDRTEKASHEEYTSKEWTWDNQLDFNKTFGNHTIGAMGLFSLNRKDYTYSEIGKSSTDDAALMTGTRWYNLYTGTADAANTGTTYWEESMISYALRANYSYLGKYMLTATVRTDGSSKFLHGYRWGWFPSVAAAWRISEESFMKDINWISNLKLRASYGVTGNNMANSHYNMVGVSGPNIYAYGNTVANAYYPSGVINKTLQWEMSREWNVGIDYGFFKNRINGSIDLYTKKSSDLLYQRYLPLESGGGKLWDNVGSVRNKGIEFALNTVNVQTKDLTWTTSFNFARNINKVLKINGEDNLIDADNPITNSLFVGSPVNVLYAQKWDGIVSDKFITVPNNQAAIDNGFTPGEQVRSRDYYWTVYKWSEGMPILRDVDGNGSIGDEDKMILGSKDPSWTANFSSSLQYKNIDFSFSIYTKQHFWAYSPFNADNYDYNYRGWNNYNMDYYIPAGTIIDCDGVNPDGTYINPVYQETTHYGSYPFPNAATTNNGMGQLYDKGNYNLMGIDKISYWKVKNITLGYTFPKSLLTPWGCKSLRVYVNVTNPFVFTKYKGFDPEWAGASMANDGPSTITYQIGASVKF